MVSGTVVDAEPAPLDVGWVAVAVSMTLPGETTAGDPLVAALR